MSDNPYLDDTMAERDEAGRAEAAQEDLDDLEAPDADLKGGGGSGTGGSSDPTDEW